MASGDDCFAPGRRHAEHPNGECRPRREIFFAPFDDLAAAIVEIQHSLRKVMSEHHDTDSVAVDFVERDGTAHIQHRDVCFVEKSVGRSIECVRDYSRELAKHSRVIYIVNLIIVGAFDHYNRHGDSFRFDCCVKNVLV